MIERMGHYFAGWARRYMPDPFLFALLLTFVTLVLGIIFTDNGLFDMIKHWEKGFWALLEFAMQMCLILVTGHALASSGPVRRAINALAEVPKNMAAAATLTALVACIAAYINWGLGMIVGAIFAREVARGGALRKIPMHYPLLAAAAYAGQLTWHGGLSGSAPLLVATPGHFLEKEIGIIPVAQTLFTPLNIATTIGLMIVVPVVCRLMVPKDSSDFVPMDPAMVAGEGSEEKASGSSEHSVAEIIENSSIISMVIGVMGIAFIAYYFGTQGLKLNLNVVNFTFLFMGIILHRTPMNYMRAAMDGAKACGGIILQFPFYAGIMGMMRYSGLVSVMAGWFTAISNPVIYPVLTFISAGFVNLFVPSGGGQWAVQGPVMVEASKVFHFSITKTIMAVAYGDEWTNMFQPFWTLPILGITGLKVRDIIGYTMVVMFITFFVYFFTLLILPG